LLGMTISCGLWWLYFDFISHRAPKEGRVASMVWMYLHLPITAGIVATGAAVLNVVEHAGEPLSDAGRWLMVLSVALAIGSIAVLMQVLSLPGAQRRMYRIAGKVTVASAAVIVGLGFSGIDVIPLLCALTLLMFLPVFYGIKIWITVFGATDMPME
jgi:low temperature requirement protein LtrA